MRIYVQRNARAKKNLRRLLKGLALGFAGYAVAYNFKDMVRYIKMLRM